MNRRTTLALLAALPALSLGFGCSSNARHAAMSEATSAHEAVCNVVNGQHVPAVGGPLTIQPTDAQQFKYVQGYDVAAGGGSATDTFRYCYRGLFGRLSTQPAAENATGYKYINDQKALGLNRGYFYLVLSRDNASPTESTGGPGALTNYWWPLVYLTYHYIGAEGSIIIVSQTQDPATGSIDARVILLDKSASSFAWVTTDPHAAATKATIQNAQRYLKFDNSSAGAVIGVERNYCACEDDDKTTNYIIREVLDHVVAFNNTLPPTDPKRLPVPALCGKCSE